MLKKYNRKIIILLIILFIIPLTSAGVIKNAKDQSNMKNGDYVLFGKYSGKPILWRVINIDSDGTPFLFSEKSLCSKTFIGGETWEDSTIREWLNSSDKPDGFLSNFSKEESSLIKQVNHKNILPGNKISEAEGGTEVLPYSNSIRNCVNDYNNAYYKNITDKVFLIDIKELHDYVYNRGWALLRPLLNNVTDNSLYYTRTTSTVDGNSAPYAVSASKYPQEYDDLISTADDESVGIVPALCLTTLSTKEGNGTVDSPYTITNDIQVPKYSVPNPPANFKYSFISSSVGKFIKLSWGKVNKAVRYKIYYKEDNGSYSLYQSLNEQEAILDDLFNSSNYSFVVTTENQAGESKFSTTVNVKRQIINSNNMNKKTLSIGDYVKFGKYNGKSILWQVINIDKDGAPLLCSDKIICFKPFDAAESGTYWSMYNSISKKSKFEDLQGSTKWDNSNIREWLNSDDKHVKYSTQPPAQVAVNEFSKNYYADEAGFLTNFNKAELNKIKIITHKTILDVKYKGEADGGTQQYKFSTYLKSIQNYDKTYYKNVKDKVFLLDEKDINDSMKKDTDIIFKKCPTKEATIKFSNYYTDVLADPTEEFNLYWLRSPNILIYPPYKGSFMKFFTAAKDSGIVPCIYLNSAKFIAGEGTPNNPYLITTIN
jgi:co-chaperonin GroES (HSP10)